MQTMLSQRQAQSQGTVRTVKPFRLQPRVIYLKNSRDKVLLMTDKRAQNDAVDNNVDRIPECEHGYWGGFSPQRNGKYQNKELSKMYTNGRARLYPSSRRLPGSLKKSSGTPNKSSSTQ